eukprot:TRINITY_DN373_c2_g1_i5.p1 TRINITY_DN373_c2_g1~~TRINITY_DN373_c2_g1_i5.p1  ORF type:complete len:428 (-),score=93.68 TRINITY_DN373_c2_g1_i5:333-1616(-)
MFVLNKSLVHSDDETYTPNFSEGRLFENEEEYVGQTPPTFWDSSYLDSIPTPEELQQQKNVDFITDPTTQRYVIVDLYHKQRGMKGMWSTIELGDLIRVTKQIGKRIKVVVRAGFVFDKTQFQLGLNDLIQPSKNNAPERFSIESVSLKDNELGGKNAEIELKIYTLSKKLEFEVKIDCECGLFQASSHFFETHNSGKQRKKKENLPAPNEYILMSYPVLQKHGSGTIKRKRKDSENVSVKRRKKSCKLDKKPVILKEDDQFGGNDDFQKVIAHVKKQKKSKVAISILHKSVNIGNRYFLVLYKNGNLYSEQVIESEEYKYILIEPEEDGSFDGVYTAVVCFKDQPIALDGAMTSLIDLRNGESPYFLPCNITPISKQCNLWSIGKFSINDRGFKWIQEVEPVCIYYITNPLYLIIKFKTTTNIIET